MSPVDPSSFDIFISYKNSDAEGELTPDAKMAFELHRRLEERGLRSFCSTLSLTRMGQSDYKNAINQALDAAKVLVVVGTDLDNILSPWVKYEWGSFHNDLLTGRKDNGTLVSYISGMSPNDLPRELRGYEAFLVQQGGDERIVDFIQACIENKARLGTAGVKLSDTGGLSAISGSASQTLVNAEDPDVQKTRKARRTKALVAGVLVVAVVVIAIAVGVAVQSNNQRIAAEQERARIQTLQEEQAQQAAEEQAQKEAEAAKQTSYTVRYLNKSTQKALKKTKTVDGEVGESITEKAPAIKGYELTSKKTAKVTLVKDAKSNVITFTYKKKATQTETDNTGTDDGGSSYTNPSSGGSGGSSGGKSGGGGSVPPGAIVDK